MGRIFLVIFVSFLLGGCYSQNLLTQPQGKKIEMEIVVHRDPEVNFASYKRFIYPKLHQKDQNELVEKELAYLIIAELKKKGYNNEIVSPDFIVAATYKVDLTKIGWFKALTIYMIDIKKRNIVWEGTAFTMSNSMDIMEEASCMVKELLSEFPYSSGKSSKRVVRCP
jgi:hypothetical protein